MTAENHCQYYRQKAGLLQLDVARSMGTTQQKVSELEADPWHVSLRRLLAYATAVGVPLVALLPDVARLTTSPQQEDVCPQSPIPTR
jgi:transcriptional regulator with XRE-family HTH domain